MQTNIFTPPLNLSIEYQTNHSIHGGACQEMHLLLDQKCTINVHCSYGKIQDNNQQLRNGREYDIISCLYAHSRMLAHR